MRIGRWSLLAGMLCVGACSHKQKVDEPVPTAGQVQRADPAFSNNDPASRKACKGDADCGAGELCLPDQLRCISSYPEPRMLDVSFNVSTECQLVNVFFPFDSAELVDEAQRWLAYNARCMKTRKGGRVVVVSRSDPRGDSAYNLDLSKRRAEAVKQKLIELGVSLPIDASGRGEEHLAGQEATERNFAWNRRASFSMQ
jgi:outer membrane protein OmpA-like peptidoglycan-associated protein